MASDSKTENDTIRKNNEEFWVLDECFKTERVAQALILGVTVHLASSKFMKTSADTALFTGASTMVAAFLVGSYVNYRARSRDNGINGNELKHVREFLPSFNVLYLLYLPFMLSMLFQRRLAPINCALAFNAIDMPFVLRWMLEAILVLINDEFYHEMSRNLKAIVLNGCLSYVLQGVGHLKSFDIVECNLFSMLLTNVLYLINSDELHFQVLQKTLIAFLASVSVNCVWSLILPKRFRWLRSIVLLASFAAVFPFTIIQTLTIDGQNPAVWLVDYISSSESRTKILGFWLLCLLILIPNIMVFKSNMSLNTSRKVWHFIVMALIIGPLQIDPQFVKIATSGTVVLFLIVEYIRYLKLVPAGEYLDEKLRSFADFRDERGPIIISYIYLIVGVATPLLINGSLVGVVSLGVGDSLASIVGHKWGRIKWPGTNKTVEGTCAFIIATAACNLILQSQIGEFPDIGVANVILTAVLSGILEGNSVLNDNILIPAFMLITTEVCKGI
ncbi:LAMI_0F10000g1_1 [Lachancea mirantina]|uniref:dolichol kinase n=1 Tax=Lachancea mirantina TaxID=1230905 RepID=A0A1G4K1J0_9SACH|nr:LAMI_0F10000g1_1 [Lachancea mirantina]